MRGDDRLKLARRGAQRAHRAVKNSSGDAGRYSRSFGLSASLASPPCGEWKAYRVTAAIARNSIQNSQDLFDPGRAQQNGSPSWIRIEPCAAPQSQPLGGFWKISEGYASPPRRHGENICAESYARSVEQPPRANAIRCVPLPLCPEAFPSKRGHSPFLNGMLKIPHWSPILNGRHDNRMD
jgi:hypothetical protein